MSAEEIAPLCRATNISVHFGGLCALDNVSIDVPSGVITGLVGPNGAGKSTLLAVLSGILTAQKGTIEFMGLDITDDPTHVRARKGLARTFQNSEIFPSLTIREHFLLSDRLRFSRHRLSTDLLNGRGFTSNSKEENERVDELLELLGLYSLSERIADGLPLGLIRLIDIGRALALSPRLILMDEPCAGLDTIETRKLADTLEMIVKENLTILLVEHDLETVLRLSSLVHVLDFGECIASATPREIKADARVRSAYLGDFE